MVNSILLDASYLVSLGHRKEINHHLSREFAATIRGTVLTPDVVLVEAMYNLQRLGGTIARIRFAEMLNIQRPNFVSLTNGDFDRAIALMRRYKDAELDFVDCCITAMAERLNITQICTYDRRDFSMIRPDHTDYFELLP
jgi:uncharacterized protein